MVSSFRGRHTFLSNFYPARVEFEGGVCPSVEHAYQAAKTLDLERRLPFQTTGIKGNNISAATAKKFGRRLLLRPDWESVKLDVMATCLKSKFSDLELRDRLLATGDEELVEGNDWGERFWGVCFGSGENHLGRLLMKLREELRGGQV